MHNVHVFEATTNAGNWSINYTTISELCINVKVKKKCMFKKFPQWNMLN